MKKFALIAALALSSQSAMALDSNFQCGTNDSESWGARMSDCAKVHYCPENADKKGLTCITSGVDEGEVMFTTSGWTYHTKGQSTVWKLVTRRQDPRTGEFHEVWQDSRTLKLWGDALDGTNYNFYSTVGFNAAGDQAVTEKACAPASSDKEQMSRASAANGGITDAAWGLPTLNEYQEAIQDGMNSVLPNMDGRQFWAASRYTDSDGYDLAYEVEGAEIANGIRATKISRSQNSVRCIGR